MAVLLTAKITQLADFWQPTRLFGPIAAVPNPSRCMLQGRFSLPREQEKSCLSAGLARTLPLQLIVEFWPACLLLYIVGFDGESGDGLFAAA
jgi:hypothetical protein